MVALASGAVIGGWLAEAPYWFSVTGAGAAIIFPLLAILLIPIGLTFSELTAMLPFASVDIWTTNAFGHKAGWAAQWMMFLVQVVEPPMMAFILLLQLATSCQSLKEVLYMLRSPLLFFGTLYLTLISESQESFANIFFFTMIIGSLIVSCSLFFSGHWSASNIVADGGLFPKGFHGVFIAMAVFSLKFIGFEMTPTMIEETNFPVSKMWKVILSALFVPAILYFIVVMAIGGMGSWTMIQEMGMPEPEFIKMYSMPQIIAIIAIVAGILHALTTLMGFWTSSARVLYGASQLNQLPKVFTKLNSKGQPVAANTVVLIFTIFFCIFSGDNWVQYIYAVSCVAAGLVYFACCLDAMVLRKKHPEWKRPYKAPGGNLLFIAGMIISVWIIIGSCMELNLGGYISLVAYCVVGLVMFLLVGHKTKMVNMNMLHLLLRILEKIIKKSKTYLFLKTE